MPTGEKMPRSFLSRILIVGTAILLIATAVAYPQTRLRSNESILKNTLFTLRATIDQYTFDEKKAPHALKDLVKEGYLAAIPVDPMTGEDRWIVIMEDAATAVDRTAPGIRDVHSSSDRKSLEGTPYANW